MGICLEFLAIGLLKLDVHAGLSADGGLEYRAAHQIGAVPKPRDFPYPVLVSLVQLGLLLIHDEETFAPLNNFDPNLSHAVEVSAHAPFRSGPLHAVAEAAFHGFKVAVISAIPLGQPLLLFVEIDGDSAQLGFPILPGPELVLPAVDPHGAVQPVLDGQ